MMRAMLWLPPPAMSYYKLKTIFFYARIQRSLMRALVFCCALILFFALSLAPTNAQAELPNKELDKISESAEWLALSYYHKGYLGGYRSEILNADYFVAANGAEDPREELRTFAQQMEDYAQDGLQAESLCHFPARITLLQKQSSAFRNFKRPLCNDYETMNRPADITDISLVFASGYFDNPSSFYGHVMLKLDYDDSPLNQDTLDASLNYGAINTDKPSNPLYIIRGVFGGYEASYKRNNEFLNAHTYTNVQIRDLWEYRLKLSEAQRVFVVEHLWELSRARFSYYFFNDNCAHRIARIVEEATGKKLTDTTGFWLLPTQVLRKLRHGNGPDLIAKESYDPSLKTRFSAAYDALNTNQKEALVAYLELDPAAQKDAIASLSTNLLRMALDYYDLTIAKLKEQPKNLESIATIQQRRSLILLAMLQQPVNSLPQEMQKELPFHSLPDSRPEGSLRADIGYSDHASNGFTRLTYRPANNDLLDNPISGQSRSRFLMGNAQIELEDHQLRLRKLVVADILNLNTNPLPTSLTNEYSWGMRIDYSPRTELCTHCDSAGIEGKIGKATYVSRDLLVYGLVGARLHSWEEDTRSLANISGEFGAIVTPNETYAFQLGGQYARALDGRGEDIVFNFEGLMRLSPQFDARVNASTDGSHTKLSTGIAWYFD
ncbi:MAG: DUF4105 domain-containing protein [Rickettsiales bacterium]